MLLSEMAHGGLACGITEPVECCWIVVPLLTCWRAVLWPETSSDPEAFAEGLLSVAKARDTKDQSYFPKAGRGTPWNSSHIVMSTALHSSSGAGTLIASKADAQLTGLASDISCVCSWETEVTEILLMPT